MNPLVTLTFATGKVGFAGMVRGGDEKGHHVFRVELPSRPAMHGEWKPRFAENGNDFDVEIVSFGYVDERNVGNPDPRARQHLSPQETTVVEHLVAALFASADATSGIAPFSSKIAVYLGGVVFKPGWVETYAPTALH